MDIRTGGSIRHLHFRDAEVRGSDEEVASWS
jgi:hypothetical protein